MKRFVRRIKEHGWTVEFDPEVYREETEMPFNFNRTSFPRRACYT